MFIIGDDVGRAGDAALALARSVAGQVAELESAPWAVRHDLMLRLDLEAIINELRHEVSTVLAFAAALGAAPAQINDVEAVLIHAVRLAGATHSLSGLPVKLAELTGTLAAEAVVHALPRESLALIDPVAAAIPDGPGWAVPAGAPTRAAQSPTSAAGWLQTVARAQAVPGQIEVTRLDNGRWVVSLPGIHSFTEAPDPLDLPGAAHAFGSGHGAYAGAVVMALTLAGVPRGAQLLLVGHSQGGIVAADLAADPEVAKRWEITQLLTAAAPIDDTSLPDKTGVLALRNRDDIVPELDLRPDRATPPDSATAARLPREPAAPRATIAFEAERGNIGANHDLAATYVPFAQGSAFAADPGVRAWDDAARAYLTGGAATTQRFQLLDRAPASPK